MVGVFTAQIIDMQRNQGVVNQPLEKFAHEVDIKRADRGPREIDAEDEPGTP